MITTAERGQRPAAGPNCLHSSAASRTRAGGAASDVGVNDTRAHRLAPVLAVTLALAGAMGVAGCGTDTAVGGTPTVTATTADGTPTATALSTTEMATTVPIVASPSTRPTTATTGAGRGCSSTGGGVPAGASHRLTIDVDGDGRRDTEWVTSSPDGSIRFGISTASGATFSAPWQSASPVERVVLVARPKPGAQPVILADDGRMVGLFTVLDCAIRPVTNVQGDQYRFDLGFADTGTGVGCLGPGDRPGLTGLNLLPTTDQKHYTITRTFVDVAGSKATNGRRDTLHVTLPAGQAAVGSATAVTCGTQTMDHDGLAAPQQ